MSPEDTTPGKRPGQTWRILARDGDREITMENQGVFDELVIDQWLHLEQMDERAWWLRVGDARINIEIDAHGEARISVERDVY